MKGFSDNRWIGSQIYPNIDETLTFEKQLFLQALYYFFLYEPLIINCD